MSGARRFERKPEGPAEKGWLTIRTIASPKCLDLLKYFTGAPVNWAYEGAYEFYALGIHAPSREEKPAPTIAWHNLVDTAHSISLCRVLNFTDRNHI